MFVIAKSRFEISKARSIIQFGSIVRGYFCLIYNSFLFAFAVKWASGFYSAITF